MKIALVYSFRSSEWFSVTKILKNLTSLYVKAFSDHEIVHVDLSNRYSAQAVLSAKKDIVKAQIRKLIFIDHRPHPHYLLSRFSDKELSEIEEFTFHLYGDFMLDLKYWALLQKILSKSKVKFVCASDKQRRVVENLLVNKSNIFKCPFPVSKDEFRYNTDGGALIKKKLGLSKDDISFFYVGRISEQKRNLETIKVFLEMRKNGELDSKHKFFIAGSFDNIGNPYLEQGHYFGEYYRKVMRVLESYDERIASGVIFLGELKNSELIHYYNTFDYFLSMSTYHDEDYGMAVAEAVCCGQPCIITDWAGYSSFRLRSENDHLSYVSVGLKERGPSFSEDELRSHLLRAKSYKEKVGRKEISRLSLEEFSIDAQVNNLREIHSVEIKETFQGFNNLFKRIVSKWKFKNAPFMDDYSKTFTKYYYKVYGPYVR